MLLQHERIWITGAQGQVGSAFARMLDTTELDVLLTDIDEVDITDMDAVRNYAEMYRPVVSLTVPESAVRRSVRRTAIWPIR